MYEYLPDKSMENRTGAVRLRKVSLGDILTWLRRKKTPKYLLLDLGWRFLTPSSVNNESTGKKKHNMYKQKQNMIS